MKTTRLISILLIAVLLCAFLTACGEKTATTVIDFEKTMSDKGFNVNVSAPETSPAITAVAKNEGYEIYFYEFQAAEGEESGTSTEYATRIYESIKNDFDNKENSKLMKVELTMPTYAYYHFIASDKYYIVSRIGNTVMFANTSDEYTEEVKALFEELGYK